MLTSAREGAHHSFGNLVLSTDTILDNLHDAGREFEPETMLYYYRARYYDPETGGFNDGMVGFCDLIPMDEQHIELHLFIEPKHIRKGHGKLWDYAVNLARQLGFRMLVLTADPNAQPFYEHHGAVRVGEKVSSVRPDRNCRSWSNGSESEFRCSEYPAGAAGALW